MATTKHQTTVYDITLTSEFQRLLPKMATFVMAYCQNFIDSGRFDRTAAVKFSYDTHGEESARTFGYQVEKNSKVRKIVKRFLDSRRAA